MSFDLALLKETNDTIEILLLRYAINCQRSITATTITTIKIATKNHKNHNKTTTTIAIPQSPEALQLSEPQQDDLRLSGHPPGQGAGGRARTRDKRVPADPKSRFVIHCAI
ncbi:hypothetical protein PoB_002655700 [Plakobranchus ocellatus]|uniref:Uncharacterized protein n=1 Tax=Plakobranchus ocellatus TaxID=259542 RepID=A0AAV3ZYA7_9GAST|nr:hypothetical protein PoB_002655700 [Plakobranchus ocellatus]